MIARKTIWLPIHFGWHGFSFLLGKTRALNHRRIHRGVDRSGHVVSSHTFYVGPVIIRFGSRPKSEFTRDPMMAAFDRARKSESLSAERLREREMSIQDIRESRIVDANVELAKLRKKGGAT